MLLNIQAIAVIEAKMSAVQNRPKRLESVISFCLLVVLILIAAVIILRQCYFKKTSLTPQTYTAAAIQSQKTQAGKTEKIPLTSFAPTAFETLSKAKSYNPDNLYEKINGKAPLYLESGFTELFTHRVISKNAQYLWFEIYIYDMANNKNAFSVFSRQKRAEAAFISIFPTDFGYRTTNALYFVHGRYYIELVGASVSNELFNAMTQTALNIQNNLTIRDVEIPEISLLPTENIIPGSFKLYLTNTFGFEGLTDTFTALYQSGDSKVVVFLSKRTDEQDAKAVAESYYNFLIQNGGTEKNIDELPVGRIVDFYGTTEIIFAVGQFVAGVHEAENQQSSISTATMLYRNLSKKD